MKTYIVSTSDYMGDEPDMFSIEAKNDDDAILSTFFGEWQIEIEEEGCTKEELLQRCLNDNGDGQPYMQIFSLEKDEVIFG